MTRLFLDLELVKRVLSGLNTSISSRLRAAYFQVKAS